jgi:hypothetical protein
MKTVVLKLLLVLLVCVCASQPLSAQRANTFVTIGSHTDDGRHFTGVTTGVVYDIAHAWLSVGAEGDILSSGRDAAFRGGPVAQFNLLRGRRVRPFAIGGYKWGEGNGTVIGAGMQFRPRETWGIRAFVEDVLDRQGALLCGGAFPPCSALPHNGNAYFRHGMSYQVGVVFP